LLGFVTCRLQIDAASSDQEELPDLFRNEQLYCE
jgi:hypothetical protein